MSLDEKRNAYRAFFTKNDAGKQFVEKLYDMINTNHADAESNPEEARDHAQRAKGIRQIIEHIQSLTAERSMLKRNKS